MLQHFQLTMARINTVRSLVFFTKWSDLTKIQNRYFFGNDSDRQCAIPVATGTVAKKNQPSFIHFCLIHVKEIELYKITKIKVVNTDRNISLCQVAIAYFGDLNILLTVPLWWRHTNYLPSF